MSKINVLDCTLRDGSYQIDYQFSAGDTAIIAAALENAGFTFIEIGHGLGLGASTAGEGVAAATDEEYLKAASSSLKKAKFGAFFIPGIGRKDDLKLAAKYGMDFVRIGTNAPEVKKAEDYIKLAKELGMEVAINLMKSYALKPVELVKQVKLAKEWGADIAYVVDSAGGMLPRQVSEYIKQLRDNIDITVGFHGHNNFDLAIANTLSAIESGATYVDCTLQGIGRSAGNAPSEILLMILEKLGYKTGIEPLKVMNLGESLIKPMMKSGISSIDIVEGYALFHSKFLEKVYRVAETFKIDSRELILNTSKSSNLLDIPEELLMSVAVELSKKENEKNGRKFAGALIIDVDNVFDKNLPVSELAKEVAKKLSSVAKKSRKTSVFTIASSKNNGSTSVSPFIRESDLFIIGNSVVTDKEAFKEILYQIDGKIDILLIDDEIKDEKFDDMYLSAKSIIKNSRVFAYCDESLLARICEQAIFQLANGFRGKKITVFGSEMLGNLLSLYLVERGANVLLYDDNLNRLKTIVAGLNLIKSSSAPKVSFTSDISAASRSADILVGTTHNKPVITVDAVSSMIQDGFVFDAGIGSVHVNALECALQRGINTYRPDMKAGLSGDILSILETDYQLTSILGKTKIGEISVVAGGVLGRKGDVIVDSISNPTTILGIADGNGGFIKDTTLHLEKIKKVNAEILRRKMVLSLERTQDHN